jgi:hypothetical protein
MTRMESHFSHPLLVHVIEGRVAQARNLRKAHPQCADRRRIDSASVKPHIHAIKECDYLQAALQPRARLQAGRRLVG